MNFLNWLYKQNNIVVFSVAALLIAVIGVADYYTGYEMSLSLFYLIPIMAGAWKNRWTGIFMAIFSAVTWSLTDMTAGKPVSNVFFTVWEVGMRLTTNVVISLLTFRLSQEFRIQKEFGLVDFLTKISNGRSFSQSAAEELVRASRYKEIFTVVYFDADNFKMVNDTLGHDAGDTVLTVVADTMKKQLRSGDIAARLGGDEFAIILPSTGAAAARVVVEKLNIELLKAIKEFYAGITFSFGVVTFVIPPANIHEMLKLADNLMYQVKRKGKNSREYLSVE